MQRRGIAAGLAVASLGFLLAVRPVAAQGQPVHLFISNGVKAVIDEIKPQAEKAIGHPLAIDYGTTTGLKARIESGASFDATILTSEAIADLLKQGKLDTSNKADLARCGIGVGARVGAAKPDIRTPDALKQTLLHVKSVAYAKDGASRVHLEQMFEQFGIAQEMKQKSMLEAGSARSNELVSEGKADLVLTLVSEILPAKGVFLVGPLPATVQSYVNFSFGTSSKSANGGASLALLRFLKSPASAKVFRAKGLEPR